MSPSEMIGWECGACTFTNDDCSRRDCMMCMTERPERYAIVTGAAESASARTTTVNRRAQALLAARSSDASAIAGDTSTPAAEGVGIRRACCERREQERQAALREGAAAEEEVARREPIAEGAPVVILGGGNHPIPPPANVSRSIVVGRLVGTLVDIVGTNANDRGRTCPHHYCCGEEVTERTMVAFCRQKLVFRDGVEEDVLAVYLCMHSVLTCKVGFFPAHLNRCAHEYDGLVARVISVYSDRCTNVVKRQKFWRNKGCCVARIVGEHIAAS